MKGWDLDMIDEKALRQILREAISTAVHLKLNHEDFTTSLETLALVRCAGYVLGGTYHVGYDQAAGRAWLEMVERVRNAIAVVTREADERWTTYHTMDAVDSAVMLLTGSLTMTINVDSFNAALARLDTCSQCSPSHDRGDGRCERHGKRIAEVKQ